MLLSRQSRSPATSAVAAALAVVAAAAVAEAAVTVYNNEFASRTEYRDVAKLGGKKACDHDYKKKGGSARLTVRKAEHSCAFRPPVVGDSELPNHEVTVVGKVLDSTKKAARGGAFIEVAVRVGAGGRYSLRVVPQKQRFELLRAPAGGEFPVTGRSREINGVGKRNTLRLVAIGGEISAFANGAELARVTDSNLGEMTGRKIHLGLGNAKDTPKDVIGSFKRISVAVP
jgi:hypothetical protein